MESSPVHFKYPEANSLHNLHHYNWTFRIIESNTFNISNKQYVQSLEVFGVLGVFVATVLLILIGLIQFCLQLRKYAQKDHVYPRMVQTNPLSNILLGAFGLFSVLLTVLWLYYGGVKVEMSFTSIEKNLENISDTFLEYNELIEDIKSNLTIIKIDSGVDVFGVLFEQLISELDEGKLPEVNGTARSLSHYNTIREITTLGLCIVIILTCAVLIGGLCYQKLVLFYSILAMFIVNIFLASLCDSTYFSAAVACSDFCISKEVYIEYLNKMDFIDWEEGKKPVCTPKTQRLINSVENVLNSSAIKVLTGFSSNIDNIRYDLSKMKEVFICNQILERATTILDTMCADIVADLLKFCIVGCVLVFLLWCTLIQVQVFCSTLKERSQIQDVIKATLKTGEYDENQYLLEESESSFMPAYATMSLRDEDDLSKSSILRSGASLYYSLLSSLRGVTRPASTPNRHQEFFDASEYQK